MEVLCVSFKLGVDGSESEGFGLSDLRLLVDASSEPLQTEDFKECLGLDHEQMACATKCFTSSRDSGLRVCFRYGF